MYLYKNTLVYLSDNRQIVYYDLRSLTVAVDQSTVVDCLGMYRDRLYALSGGLVSVIPVGKRRAVKRWRADDKAEKEDVGREMILTCVKATEEGVYLGRVSKDDRREESDRQIGVVEMRDSWTGKRYSSLQLKCQIFSGRCS